MASIWYCSAKDSSRLAAGRSSQREAAAVLGTAVGTIASLKTGEVSKRGCSCLQQTCCSPWPCSGCKSHCPERSSLCSTAIDAIASLHTFKRDCSCLQGCYSIHCSARVCSILQLLSTASCSSCLQGGYGIHCSARDCSCSCLQGGYVMHCSAADRSILSWRLLLSGQ